MNVEKYDEDVEDPYAYMDIQDIKNLDCTFISKLRRLL